VIRRTLGALSLQAVFQIGGIAFISLLLPFDAQAQLQQFNAQDMTIDADSSIYDGKTSTVIFKGLHLSQGLIGIQADEARVRNRELENSTWRFSGNVIIDVGDGHIECDNATLDFDDFKLKLAVVTGSPATYKLTREGKDNVTHAEAGHLSYRVDEGIIEFSDNAVITEGGNQFSSNLLIYNIGEQRIRADSNGAEDDRVRLIYTPNNGSAAIDNETDLSEDDVKNQ
jgi:lipopolysaccharide transport protein LptA